jgi:transmembrane sensor
VTTVELTAGDVGTVAANGTATRRRDPNVARFEAWTSGQLVFDDRPLAAVVAELGRWFDVDIRIADSAVARRRVNGVYGTPSLEGVLDALAASLAIHYERDGRTVTISPSPSPSPRAR